MNLEERVLEVYRESGPDVAAAHGWAYRTTRRLRPEDCVTPLAAPSARIRVVDLLP